MKSISEYLDWLNELNEKSSDFRTSKSIQKLINLLSILNAKNIFDHDAYKILQRLDKMKISIDDYPVRTKYFIDRCTMEITNISAKFFNLVKRNHYQNEWGGFGMSMGIVFGVILYAISNNPAYIGFGIPIGLAIGLALGIPKDNKAAKENRVLNI